MLYTLKIDIYCETYLLHLVGCNVFVDKCVMPFSILYRRLLNNLPEVIGGYVWEAVILTHLHV